MTTDRTSRESATREKTSRRKPWAPPSALDAPPPPPGFKHRWVRVEMMGQMDKNNVYGRLRQGYEPVRADEYPDFDAPTVDEGKYQGVIGTGGLILTRVPVETAEERSAYYGNRTRQQMQAVDEDLMKEEHPSMKIHQDRKSRVSFGGRNDS